MSDPTTTPKQLTVSEYETLLGQVAALELLSAQAWVFLIKTIPENVREEFIQDQLIQLEERFHRLHPLAQQVALEKMDCLLGSALITARQC